MPILFLKALWNNKPLRNIILSVVACLIILFTIISVYKSIYNKGYNEAVKITQEQLNTKYNKAVEKIIQENKAHVLIEKEKFEESLQQRELLLKEINDSDRKIQQLIKKSKSNLVNPECKVSKEELDFYNNN